MIERRHHHDLSQMWHTNAGRDLPGVRLPGDSLLKEEEKRRLCLPHGEGAPVRTLGRMR